jgi:hypothetical protein
MILGNHIIYFADVCKFKGICCLLSVKGHKVKINLVDVVHNTSWQYLLLDRVNVPVKIYF